VLSTGSDNQAGVFVPNEIDYAVHELALQYGVFRQFAEVVPMGSDTKDSPRWTAGMTAYWTAEGNKPTSSDPAWDLIKLVAKDLKAMTKMTRNLDEDSAVDLGDKITMALAEAFTYAEDQAGFIGDGTSTYGGIVGLTTKILAASAAFHTAATGNVSDITLDLDDFNGAVAKLPNWPNFNPVWFMHKTVWANSAQRLQMALGGVVPADVQAGARPMLLGYPVVFVNVMDSTPTVSELAAILGDLRWSSKVGDRRGRLVETGYENDDFTKGLVTILGTQRVDVINHTITDPRSSSNTGPVVGLKLAAS
jgi:HK97 family phage major capsid protein